MSRGFDASAVDWSSVADALNERGFAQTGRLLSAADCDALTRRYDDEDGRFRATIDMSRFNFGRGQYRYFSYPLPDLVESLRTGFYRHLAPIANDWSAKLGMDVEWPAELSELLERCHAAGQARPTPLMLKYGSGDYNCLHQDLYGALHFPLQVVIALCRPEKDYDGGELVLVEQRPRMQSRPMVVRLDQGCAAIIPVRERPRRGARGYHRAIMRHGVSEISAGHRYTLGIIFHDAA